MSKIVNLCDRWKIKEQDYIFDEERVLVGSYSCVNYLKYLVSYFEKNECYNINYDIVLPVFPEDQLEYLQTECMHKIIDNCNCIVVNDFGMLEHFKEYKNIRLGRLFFKDYKDKRYEKYDTGRYKLKFSALLSSLKKMGYSIHELECDCVSQNFEIESTDDVKVYVHYPYRQLACGHICEFASIGKRIEKKFLPDDICSMQCRGVMIKTQDPEYIKIGNCVYDLLDSRYIDGFLEDYEIIFTPRW